jgi:hypothetical protein
MNRSDEALVSAIRDRLGAGGMTQTEMAQKLNINQGHLCKLVNGRPLGKKSRDAILSYLDRDRSGAGAEDASLTAARGLLRRGHLLMHNMQILLTDMQRLCDEIGSTGQKAKT